MFARIAGIRSFCSSRGVRGTVLARILGSFFWLQSVGGELRREVSISAD